MILRGPRISGSQTALLFAFALTTFVGARAPLATAQTVVLEGVGPDAFDGGEAKIQAADDLSDEQRAEIQRQVDAGIENLRRDGVLPPQGLTPQSTILYDWPLQPVPTFSEYGYHGISNFVDQNPNYPGLVLDYNCGSRTYDTATGYNHKGIDFFLWPFPWNKVDAGTIQVVAAAEGTIVVKVDGSYDRNCAFNSNAWNAVYVVHADGSQAWYGHMKAGSITYKPVGSAVARGEYLGLVASSGNSTGPHLHLETHDPGFNLIEPYAGPCNTMNASSWWTAQRPYYDSAINQITTGPLAPVLNPCPNPDNPNASDYFNPGDMVFFTSYYRDQLNTQTGQHTIYRPDNSVYSSWSFTSPATHYAASYWYWQFVSFAPSGPTGTWRYDIDFDGQTYSHEFFVINGPTPTATPSPTPTPPPGACASTPVSGCDTPLKSTLIVKDNLGIHDKLKWKFVKGSTSITKAGFGDPANTDTVAFCLYDSSGPGSSAALKLVAFAAPGPKWSLLGQTGFKFNDPTTARYGTQLVSLRAGPTGQPKPPTIVLKGKGEGLYDPIPPSLTLPVRAQLLSSNGACWEATYAGAIINDSDLFKAKIP